MRETQHGASPSSNPPPAKQPTFLTVIEVADILRINRMSVYRLLDRGDLRGYRFGRTVRVNQRDLNDYIRSAERTDGAA